MYCIFNSLRKAKDADEIFTRNFKGLQRGNYGNISKMYGQQKYFIYIPDKYLEGDPPPFDFSEGIALANYTVGNLSDDWKARPKKDKPNK
jgi:hypothetical protein